MRASYTKVLILVATIVGFLAGVLFHTTPTRAESDRLYVGTICISYNGGYTASVIGRVISLIETKTACDSKSIRYQYISETGD